MLRSPSATHREMKLTEEQTGTEQTGTEQAATEQAATEQTAPAEAAPTPAPAEEQSTPAPAPEPPKKKRTKSSARKTRTVELTLTVTGTAEGEWQAELVHAGKRVVQGLQIPASSVSRAAAELHQEIAERIDTVITQAREQQQAKLAELEAEMERVRKALADLEG
jgi:hypothetical protein